MDRHRPSDEACTATLGHDSQFSLVTITQNCTDVSSRPRFEHQLRGTRILVRPVSVMDGESIRVSDHVLATDDTFEEGDVLYEGSIRRELTYLAI